MKILLGHKVEELEKRIAEAELDREVACDRLDKIRPKIVEAAQTIDSLRSELYGTQKRAEANLLRAQKAEREANHYKLLYESLSRRMKDMLPDESEVLVDA